MPKKNDAATVTYSLASSLFIIDTANKPSGDPVTALEAIAALGFRATELFAEGQMWEAPGPRETAKIRTALERCDIDAATLHTPLTGVNIASPNAGLREDSVRRIAESIRFAADIGARTAIVHPTGKPGPDEPQYTLETTGATMEIAFDSVGSLVKIAQEAGIRIALENLSGAGLVCRPLESMQELRAFICAFPAEEVGLCLDTGHARISGLDPAGQARIGSDRLWALHIQDVDGVKDRHWVPGQGIIDWTALGQALSDIGFNGDWTIEVLPTYSELSLPAIGEACRSLKELWERKGMCNPGRHQTV